MKTTHSKLKVLQLLSNPTIGGAETFVLSVTPVLRKLGVDARIANLWGDTVVEKLARRDGIPFVEFHGGRFISPMNIVRLATLLRREHIDIVCAYGLRANLAARLASFLAPQAIIVSCLRGIDTWRRWHHVWPDRLTQFRTRCFIGNSQDVCQVRRDREKTRQDKLFCIPNGIDVELFDRQAQEWPTRSELGLPDGLLCTTVANIRPPKGHAFLLDTLLAHPLLLEQARFLWIGDGVDKPKMQQRIHQLGLDDRILFHDLVSDVRPLLAVSDVFILPSREEGMPRALMEAMAMGLPCMATDVGGSGEVLRDGVDGFLVPYGDQEKAALRLGELISNEPGRLRMAANGAKRIRDEFDLYSIAARYAELFENLVSRK